MPSFNSAMDVFKLLEKSNCKKCGMPTCLAFAAAVFQGRRPMADCPQLDPALLECLKQTGNGPSPVEQNREAYLQQLKAAVAECDLAAAADRLDGRFANGRLTLKVLGKDFSVDTHGNLSAEIHVNPWIAVPFLHHVLYGRGLAPTGQWVSLRELHDGPERYPLFRKRAEEAMLRVADVYTELFGDMVHLFSGREVDPRFQADISVVLHPLPKVPLMVCYWRPDDGLGSSLNLFFDRTADANLDIGSLFTLGAGLAQMFEKIALRHGYAVSSD